MKYILSFKSLKPADILLLDNNYSNLNLNKFNTIIFDYKKIFFSILLISLYKFLFLNRKNRKLKELYLKTFLEKISPKVIIGHHENYLIFLIKEYYPKSKIIVYLHHRLFKSQENFLKKKSKNSFIDYFFVCDHLHKKILEKYFKCEFVISGFIKNNEIKFLNKKKVFDINFISEFRTVEYTKKKQHIKYIKYLTKILSMYCIKYNKKFIISLNSSRKDKNIDQNNEISFFKNISSNICFLRNKGSYDIANLSKITVCLNSNLGAELLSRQKKVLFLPFLDKIHDNYKNPYFNKNLFFVYKKPNKKNIFEKINLLLKMKNTLWKKRLKKENISLIFDKNNSVLKKKITKLINTKK